MKKIISICFALLILSMTAINTFALDSVGEDTLIIKDAIIEAYLDSYSTISGSYYTTANNSTIATLTHNAAVSAKSRIGNVNSILDKSKWGTNASYCLKSAARYSAMVMYKFSRVSSVPFYAN